MPLLALGDAQGTHARRHCAPFLARRHNARLCRFVRLAASFTFPLASLLTPPLLAGADGYVHFWDASSGEHKRTLRAHRTGINDISLSPDGLYLSTASDDGTALVFSMDPLAAGASTSLAANTGGAPQPRGGGPLRTLTGHTAPVLAVAFGPRANLVATGSYDESAIVWDLRRGRAIQTLPAHAEAIWTVGWDAEGALVLTGGADGLIRLWDVNTGQCLKTFDNESNSPVASAAFTPSSFFIMSATLSSTIRIYSLHNGKVLKTLQAAEYTSERYPCNAIIFAGWEGEQPNGHGAAKEGGGDAMDVDEVVAVEGVNGHGGGRAVVAADARRRGATPRPAWVVAGSENGKVVIWDLQDRRVLQVLEGHTSPVVAVAVHPDGRTLATGSLEPNNVIKLWNA